MAERVNCSYPEGVMLQEHSQTLHSLASDLQTIASQLTDQAVELDNMAHGCRKRTFEESIEQSSSFKARTLGDSGDEVGGRIAQAAAAIEVARSIKRAAKSIDADGHLNQRPASIEDSPASAISAITERFTERLLQEHKRKQSESLRLLARHQKYIGPDGLPLYMGDDDFNPISPKASSWPSVNHQHWGKTQSTALKVDEATEASLLRYVTKDGGIPTSLVLRAADRLSRMRQQGFR